jgi:hypothetical protein
MKTLQKTIKRHAYQFEIFQTPTTAPGKIAPQYASGLSCHIRKAESRLTCQSLRFIMPFWNALTFVRRPKNLPTHVPHTYATHKTIRLIC